MPGQRGMTLVHEPPRQAAGRWRLSRPLILRHRRTECLEQCAIDGVALCVVLGMPLYAEREAQPAEYQDQAFSPPRPVTESENIMDLKRRPRQPYAEYSGEDED